MAEAEIGTGAIKLEIVTPEKAVEETSVPLVTMPGSEGDFGVMPGHMPFITTLRPGVVTYEDGGMPRRLAISAGVVEVTQEKVTVLARTCERSDEIDLERAEKAKSSAEEKLAGISHDNDGWAHLEVKLNRALSRIETSNG